jgi:hypothetical protein
MFRPELDAALRYGDGPKGDGCQGRRRPRRPARSRRPTPRSASSRPASRRLPTPPVSWVTGSTRAPTRSGSRRWGRRPFPRRRRPRRRRSAAARSRLPTPPSRRSWGRRDHRADHRGDRVAAAHLARRIAGALKKKHGLTVTSEKVEGKERQSRSFDQRPCESSAALSCGPPLVQRQAGRGESNSATFPTPAGSPGRSSRRSWRLGQVPTPGDCFWRAWSRDNRSRRVGVIVTGGNVDLDKLPST